MGTFTYNIVNKNSLNQKEGFPLFFLVFISKYDIIKSQNTLPKKKGLIMKFEDLLKIIDLDNNKTIHLVKNNKMILDLELNKENFDLLKEFFEETVISIDFTTDNLYQIDDYDNYYISDVERIITINIK